MLHELIEPTRHDLWQPVSAFSDQSGYQLFLTQREALLRVLNARKGRPQAYVQDRAKIAHLALAVKPELVSSNDYEILEVGTGIGKAALTIQDTTHHHHHITATNVLTDPTDAKAILNAGIDLYTGMPAEFLPSEWSNRFDVVMTSCVLGWTDTTVAIPHILDVMKPKGIWVGLESGSAYCFDDPNTYLIDRIHDIALQHNTTNCLSHEQRYAYNQQFNLFPFVFTKP
ncbi:MAG: hypothetical protein NUV52_01750 [Candidatus Roizmanbacteria bacterium]|nr:hypothetical protein [Candidatus Roizmanbacteria bacterium]